MSIKSKIETLTASFKEAVAKYNKDKAYLKESKMYTGDYINAEIAKLDVAMNAVVADANAKLQAIFQDEIDEIRSNKTGGVDFESKLSNALTFINAYADKLTDETAFALLQPFFGDYQTMHRLSVVVAGKPGIPATRFVADGYDAAIENLKDMQVKFRGMFDNFQHDAGLLDAITKQYLLIDVDGYEAFNARLHEYLSASADDAEKVVAEYTRFTLGLKG